MMQGNKSAADIDTKLSIKSKTFSVTVFDFDFSIFYNNVSMTNLSVCLSPLSTCFLIGTVSRKI